MKNELIHIISQGFYGNRTGTELRRESVDRFILGYQTDDLSVTEPIDRTIVRLPDSKSVVLIYNKYQEAAWLETKDRALREDNYVIKPLATIPELGLNLYSRCIACRMNDNGNLESIETEDLDILDRYLAV